MATLDEAERFRLKLQSPLGVARRASARRGRSSPSGSRVLQGDLAALEAIEARVAGGSAELVRDFGFRLSDVEKVLLEFERRGNAFFDERLRLGRFRELFDRERLRRDFEAEAVAALPYEVELRVDGVVDFLVEGELRQWQDVMALLAERKAARPGAAGRVDDRFAYDRSRLLESVREAARAAVEHYDAPSEARRLAEKVRESVAQAALLQVSALGLGTIVAVLASTTAADVTGILAAGALSLIGLFLLPARREKARRELKAKVTAVREKLMTALTASFDTERARAAARVREAVAPYADFVRREKERLEQAKRAASARRPPRGPRRARVGLVLGKRLEPVAHVARGQDDAVVRGVLVPRPDQPGEPLGLGGREVARLERVFGQVEELPAARPVGLEEPDDLPVPAPQRPAPEELPAHRELAAVDGRGLAPEQRHHRSPFERRTERPSKLGAGCRAPASSRIVGATSFTVTTVSRRRAGRSAPAHDRRHAHAAFRREALPQAERRHGLGPGGTEPGVGAHAAQVGEAVVEPLRDPVGVRLHATDLVALGAVVREEEDERVVVATAVPQGLKQAADVVVEVLDHRGVDLHHAGLAPLLFGQELVPGPCESGASGFGRSGRHDAEPLRALEAPRSERVVARVVGAAVAVELGVGHLQRPVRRRVGGIGEEGPPIGEPAAEVLDQLVRVVGVE